MLDLKIKNDHTITNGEDVIGNINPLPIGADDTVRQILLNTELPHTTILTELCYYPVHAIETQYGLSYICVHTDRIASGLDHQIGFVSSLLHTNRLKIRFGDYFIGKVDISIDGFMDIDACDLLKSVVRKNIHRALAVATEHNHCIIVAAILQRELQKVAVDPILIDLDPEELDRVDAAHSSDTCYVTAFVMQEFNAATFPVKQPEREVLWVKYRKGALCYIDGVFYHASALSASSNSVSLSELVKLASTQFCGSLKILAYSRDGGPMMSATELRVDINDIPSASFSKGLKKNSIHMLKAATHLPMPALIRPLIHKACYQWN